MAEADQESNIAKTDSADEDTDEECEILEESPCGRWQKRREEVNVPLASLLLTLMLPSIADLLIYNDWWKCRL